MKDILISELVFDQGVSLVLKLLTKGCKHSLVALIVFLEVRLGDGLWNLLSFTSVRVKVEPQGSNLLSFI